MNGGWKESKEGVIDWIIERFLIFLYTRDYPVLDPEPNNIIYDIENQNGDTDVLSCDWPATTVSKLYGGRESKMDSLYYRELSFLVAN